jgi:hypothetical protein
LYICTFDIVEGAGWLTHHLPKLKVDDNSAAFVALDIIKFPLK